jgi:hypothetical protein
VGGISQLEWSCDNASAGSDLCTDIREYHLGFIWTFRGTKRVGSGTGYVHSGREIYMYSDGLWRGRDKSFFCQELSNWFAERAARDTNGIVIQEQLTNHPDLEEVCGPVLSTCRIVTILNEKDEPEIVEGHWRMAINPDAIVDNFHSGGLSWDINNYKTGEISFALHNDSHDKQEMMLSHPNTGKTLAGTHHPFWSDICDLVLSGHRSMDGVLFVGWDVAVTGEGVTVIEMNFPSDLKPNVQLKWDGINNSRLGKILAWRAQRWLRKNVEPASLRQIGADCQ